MYSTQHSSTASTLLALLLASSITTAVVAAPNQYDFDVIESRPHNPQLFTQGLEISEGQLFESSGLYDMSRLLRYPSPVSDSDIAVTTLPDDRFAEGLTVVADELYLLTWQAGELIVYDKNSLVEKRKMRYRGEGWGLCNDGEFFYMSNGSNRISVRNLQDFSPLKSLRIKRRGGASDQLNELECVGDSIWANRYTTGEILEIDKQTGEVKGYIDVSSLHYRVAIQQPGATPNGIAYDAQKDAFWITGKYWRSSFLIRPKKTNVEP